MDLDVNAVIQKLQSRIAEAATTIAILEVQVDSLMAENTELKEAAEPKDSDSANKALPKDGNV